ncbi:aryl-alcohol dehydrogenase-like predicted oxidoreductase [Friedmanniella endophytica]|uniref:Aryl-alcohol dehydrogenase-like predicted oxidoreductase n=1 Tax=Microlunatus kandeliicorticis TaxID=1759536 RepID=A0A7W3IQH6_9ACTN|nr:aldo/keto reductase [Microlunatus kandeliicorticis]MBA8793369.1 aryl-alcohol dehydrogenase-like predicted oxidoreductase [Microlunatus kandeliicorticis]
MTALPTRTLGRTGLEVTTLGYGAMEVRGSRIWGGRPVTDDQAETILHAVLDSGITFVDTANDYGRSEEFIGRFLAERRDEYVLATKCGCTVVHRDDETDDTPHVWTRDNLLRGIEESLQRMRTDHVDLLQLHNPSVEQTESNDLVTVLQEIRDQGMTRFIGISSTEPHLETYIEWGVFDAFQIPYSALERQHERLIQAAADSGAGVIIRGGVARGEPGTGLGDGDRWEGWRKAGLDELLEDGETPTQFLLRFTNAHPGMHTNIVGTLNPDHLQANVEAASRPLSEEVYAEAKRRLGAAGIR